jgi:hypothetical protein
VGSGQWAVGSGQEKRSTKLEIRNKFEMRRTNVSNDGSGACLENCDFEFLICFVFRDSDFEFDKLGCFHFGLEYC